MIKKQDFNAKFFMDTLIEASALFGFSCLFSHGFIDKTTQIIQFSVIFAGLTLVNMFRKSKRNNQK